MNARTIIADCLDALPTLEENSVDAVVTDPPYGLSFMGKDWDHGVPGTHFWREILRVMKPGAHLLAFGGSRTYHRMACAIEDAGLEVRDCIMWLYGSGFPKSKNLDREWSGWGTALKPAHEPIILARKPLDGTVDESVRKWGCGALNIDGCRIEGTVTTNPLVRLAAGFQSSGLANQGATGKGRISKGRWPANVVHDGSDEVMTAFPDATGQQRAVGPEHGAKPSVNTFGDFGPRDEFNPRGDVGSAARFFYCAKASKKDRQEGCEHLPPRRYSHDGRQTPIDNAYQRNSNSNSNSNHHPTVKPTALMRYLCRLITPQGGVILDPFMGSGSTGKAAMLERFKFIGIERDVEYAAIAHERISHAQQTKNAMHVQTDLFATASAA